MGLREALFGLAVAASLFYLAFFVTPISTCSGYQTTFAIDGGLSLVIALCLYYDKTDYAEGVAAIAIIAFWVGILGVLAGKFAC